MSDIYTDFHGCEHEDIAWRQSYTVEGKNGWEFSWAKTVALGLVDYRYGICKGCGAPMTQARGVEDGKCFREAPTVMENAID